MTETTKKNAITNIATVALTNNPQLNIIKNMRRKNLIKTTLLSLLTLQLFGTTPTMGQTKKLTLEDLMPGGSTYRFTDNLYNLQWWGDICIKPTVEELIGINPKDGKESVLTTKDKVNSALSAKNLGKLTSFYSVDLPWKERSEFVFPLRRKLI